MIPSKLLSESPRKTEQVRSGIFVARNSYSGRYVFFQRGDKKNVYITRLLRNAKPQAVTRAG